MRLDWSRLRDLIDEPSVWERQRQALNTIREKAIDNPKWFKRRGQQYVENAALIAMSDHCDALPYCESFVECGIRIGKKFRNCSKWLICPRCSHNRRAWPLLKRFGLQFHRATWYHVTLSYDDTQEVDTSHDNGDNLFCVVTKARWEEGRLVAGQLVKKRYARGVLYRKELALLSLYPHVTATAHVHMLVHADDLSESIVEDLINSLRSSERRMACGAPNVHVEKLDTEAHFRSVLSYSVKAMNFAEVYRRGIAAIEADCIDGDDPVAMSELNVKFCRFLQSFGHATEYVRAYDYLGSLRKGSRTFVGLTDEEAALREDELKESLCGEDSGQSFDDPELEWEAALEESKTLANSDLSNRSNCERQHSRQARNRTASEEELNALTMEDLTVYGSPTEPTPSPTRIRSWLEASI